MGRGTKTSGKKKFLTDIGTIMIITKIYGVIHGLKHVIHTLDTFSKVFLI